VVPGLQMNAWVEPLARVNSPTTVPASLIACGSAVSAPRPSLIAVIVSPSYTNALSRPDRSRDTPITWPRSLTPVARLHAPPRVPSTVGWSLRQITAR